MNAAIKETMGEIILVTRTSGIHAGTLLEDEAVDIVRGNFPAEHVGLSSLALRAASSLHISRGHSLAVQTIGI